jgi:hypothetical protein
MEFNTKYDIPAIAAFIHSRGYNKVALQVPSPSYSFNSSSSLLFLLICPAASSFLTLIYANIHIDEESCVRDFWLSVQLLSL